MRRRIPSIGMLLAFEAAGRSLNFTQAGEKLNLSQSAISHQILGLEEFLGLQLFERANRRLALTDEGALLLARLTPALNALEGAVLETMASSGGGGNLRIAVPPTYATKWLIPRLSLFTAQHGKTAISLVMHLDLPDFTDGQLDGAIYFGPPLPDAECDYLMTEEQVVVCSPEIAASVQQVQDLAAVPLLHLSSRPEAWADWARSAGATLDTATGPQFELFSMVAQAAAAGLGAAVLPRFLILDEIAAGRLVPVLSPPLISSDTAYYFASPRSRSASQSVQDFKRWLQAEMQVAADSFSSVPRKRS